MREFGKVASSYLLVDQFAGFGCLASLGSSLDWVGGMQTKPLATLDKDMAEAARLEKVSSLLH